MSIPPETERLRFREWSSTDLEPFHSICSDPHVIQFVEFQRITATVQLLNQGSMRVIEKLGMQPESRLSRNGRELMLYSITHETY